MQESCNNCKYVYKEKTTRTYGNITCRRRSPQILPSDSNYHRAVFGVFPTTDKDEWCGEWEAK